mmetsp:Transcript_18270/g.42595  ORF Transcript_18270/g.42595 Transcript_18270/m.42595 type:complete len:236 (-) Transcript_18270:454-1161(-)
MSSIKTFVPCSNFAISNTPMGPFQMMVLEDCTAAVFLLMDSGPQSKPMKPAGTPDEASALLISPSSPNFEEQTKSTGKTISTPAALAVSMISGTIFAPSSSKRELPISMLFSTLRKVKAMPPPIIILFTLEHRFLMSWILSLTLAPPKMAKTGLAGLSKTFAKADNSACMRKPEHLMSNPSPTMELCARCAVPKASLQYTSASLRKDARKAFVASGSAFNLFPSLSTPLPSSSTL